LPEARWPAAIAAIYAAYWQRAEDVTRDEVIAAALRGCVPEAEITSAIAGADSDAIKDDLRRRTDEAIALGIFGAPGWIIRRAGSDLIWGQDRIAWVEAALAGWDFKGPPPGGARPFGRDVQPFVSARSLDIYFDVSSPFAYFALTQVPALAEVTGTTPVLHPILLGGLFREIGQSDVPLLSWSDAKRKYTLGELDRWSQWWGVPFDFPKKFPQRTITAQRLCVLAGNDIRLATALARAMWAEQRDLEDPDTLRAILDEVGLPRAWVERTADPETKAALIEETSGAKAAGVFGVPSFVVDHEHLVWGQDRLDLVMRFAAGWDAP
jgi:2-hydroxychromene-2-carboxylate isomerase